MKKYRVISTTPIAGFPARLLLTILLLLTAYYRLKLFYLAVSLYLVYLLWSYYWAISSCRYINAKVNNSQRNIFTGETLSWEVKLANGWNLPVVRSSIDFTLPAFFAVADDKIFVSEEPKEVNAENSSCIFLPWQQYSAYYAWLKAKEEVNFTIEVKAQLRGIYYIPPVEFSVGDPSGLFYGKREITAGDYLYVYPQLQKEVAIAQALALTEKQLESGNALEDRYTVIGVRSYQLTDPIKSINWYATARTGSLKSNLYARKNSFNCLIVFDTSVYEQPADVTEIVRAKDPLLENAISFAVSLALFQLEQGAKTAFYTNSPLLQWQYREELRQTKKLPYLKRVRKISDITFADGDEQAQRILKLAASIDESSRASREEQEKLWLKVMETASDSMVYILTYNRPPAFWSSLTGSDETTEKLAENPHEFYSAARLAALQAAGYQLINLG
ncbi:MAG: DUF58 domain-containing protein [Firmicutes bacterium]|nr:DUF58 domain-containing protein [Bacillota bacterium]